jgi:hypothetical protein
MCIPADDECGHCASGTEWTGNRRANYALSGSTEELAEETEFYRFVMVVTLAGGAWRRAESEPRGGMNVIGRQTPCGSAGRRL